VIAGPRGQSRGNRSSGHGPTPGRGAFTTVTDGVTSSFHRRSSLSLFTSVTAFSAIFYYVRGKNSLLNSHCRFCGNRGPLAASICYASPLAPARLTTGHSVLASRQLPGPVFGRRPVCSQPPGFRPSLRRPSRVAAAAQFGLSSERRPCSSKPGPLVRLRRRSVLRGACRFGSGSWGRALIRFGVSLRSGPFQDGGDRRWWVTVGSFPPEEKQRDHPRSDQTLRTGAPPIV